MSSVHPIKQDLKYSIHVQVPSGCSLCGLEVNLVARGKYATSVLLPCHRCGVVRYCSRICAQMDYRAIPGDEKKVAEGYPFHSEMCCAAKPEISKQCELTIGDSDAYCGHNDFRTSSLRMAVEQVFLLQFNRPDWTFHRPSVLMYDIYRPSNIWFDRLSAVLNGHPLLVAQMARVFRILEHKVPFYQLQRVLVLDTVNRSICVLWVPCADAFVARPAKQMRVRLLETVQEKKKERRKKK